jgi:hypothetical protein
MTVTIHGPEDGLGPDTINTTSRSRTWSQGLSPFIVGPVEMYDGLESYNMENAWQYAKVYAEHVGYDDVPTEEYWEWAKEGWACRRAHRYPMGRGAKPKFSWWDGEALDYIEARKKIYIPLYARAVSKTTAFAKLRAIYEERGEVTLWDFDGYDHRALGMSYKDVVNDPTRSLGHAFVIGFLLEGLGK